MNKDVHVLFAEVVDRPLSYILQVGAARCNDMNHPENVCCFFLVRMVVVVIMIVMVVMVVVVFMTMAVIVTMRMTMAVTVTVTVTMGMAMAVMVVMSRGRFCIV